MTKGVKLFKLFHLQFEFLCLELWLCCKQSAEAIRRTFALSAKESQLQAKEPHL